MSATQPVPRPRSRLPVLALCAFAMGLALPGCAHTNPSVGWEIKNPDGTVTIERRVVVNDSAFRRHLALDGIDSQMRNGIPLAEVRVRNLSSGTLEFAYRFTWTDASGFAVEGAAGGWERDAIDGFQSKALRGVAPSTRATTFRLEIQPKR